MRLCLVFRNLFEKVTPELAQSKAAIIGIHFRLLLMALPLPLPLPLHTTRMMNSTMISIFRMQNLGYT